MKICVYVLNGILQSFSKNYSWQPDWSFAFWSLKSPAAWMHLELNPQHSSTASPVPPFAQSSSRRPSGLEPESNQYIARFSRIRNAMKMSLFFYLPGRHEATPSRDLTQTMRIPTRPRLPRDKTPARRWTPRLCSGLPYLRWSCLFFLGYLLCRSEGVT